MPAPTEVGIRIRLEGGKIVVTELQQIGAAAAAVGSQGAQAAGGSQQQGAALDGVAQAAGKAKAALEQTATATTGAATAAADAANAAGKAAEAIAETGGAAKTVAQTTDAAARGMNKASGAARVVGQEAGRAAQGLSQTAGASTQAAGAIGRMTTRVAGLGPLGIALGATAAAAGVLATAFVQAGKEQAALTASLIKTGNAADVTTGQMSAMARAIAGSVGTQGDAAAALAKLAGTGRFTGEQLQGMGEAAVAAQHAMGIAVDDTVRKFAELGRDPIAASVALNDEIHHLTASVYDQMRAAQDAGDAHAAAEIAQNAYAQTLKQRSAEIEQSLGSLERTWRALVGGAKAAWDAMLNVGRAPSVEQKIADMQEAVRLQEERIRRGPGRGIDIAVAERGRDAANAQLWALMGEKAALDLNAAAQAEVAKSTAARIAVGQTAEQYASRDTRMQRELAQLRTNYNAALASGTLTEQQAAAVTRDYDAAVAGITAKYAQAASGARKHAAATTGAYAQIMQSIGRMSAQQQLELAGGDKLNAADRLRITVMQQVEAAGGKLNAAERARIKTALDSVVASQQQIDAARALEAERQRAGKAALQQAERLEQSNEQLAREVESLGKNRTELAQLERARSASHIAELQRQLDMRLSVDLLDEQTAGIARQIDALRERTGLLDAKAAGEARAAWDKAVTDMGQQFTDALLNGGASVRDAIKRMFQGLVLRPIIAPIMAGAAGLLGTMLPGTAAAASGAGGGLSGMSGLGSLLPTGNVGSMLGAFGANFGAGSTLALGGNLGLAFQTAGANFAAGNFMSGAANVLGAAGVFAGGVFGGASVGGLVGGALGGYAAFGNANIANYGGAIAGAAIGSIIPGVGTLVGGLLGGALGGVVNALFGRKYKSAGVEGTFSGEGFNGDLWRYYKGGLFSSSKTKRDPIAGDAADAIGAAWRQITAQTAQFADTLSLDARKIAQFSSSFKITFDDKNVIKDPAKLAEAVQDALAEALRTGSNQLAEALIGSNSPFARSGEQAIDTLTRLATSLAATNSAFDRLGVRMFAASTRGADMASQLMDLFGGIDQFNAAAGSYYQAYFSQSEMLADARRDLSRSFSALGLALPTTRAEFRSTVEALDLTTQHGRETFAALMSVSDAFAALTPNLFQGGEDLAATLKAGLLGQLNAAELGERMADVVVGGMLDAIAGGFAQQITDIMMQGVINPVIQAAVAGAAVSEAVSQASIQRMVAQATAVAQALGAVLNDPGFRAAMQAIEQTMHAMAPQVGAAAPYWTSNEARAADAQRQQQAADDAHSQALQQQDSILRGLLQTMGMTDELRAQELAQLEPANRALQARVWALQDAITAAQKYNQALADARGFMANFSRGIDEFVHNTRMAQAAQTGDSYQLAAAKFSAQMTLARGGDRDALGSITGYADSLIGAIRTNAVTGADADLAINRVLAQLAELPQQLRPEDVLVGAIEQLNDDLTASLISGFDALDTSLDGLLSFDELQAAGLASDDEIRALISRVDANGDGLISKSELLRAALGAGTQSQQQYDNWIQQTLAAGNDQAAASNADRNSWDNALYGVGAGTSGGVADLKGYTLDANQVLARIDAQTHLLWDVQAAITANGQAIYGAILSTGAKGYVDMRYNQWLADQRPYATGGAFTNRVVRGPTSFPMGLMGEAGPEAIMPLANVGGNLGVSLAGVGGLLEELRALRAEVAELRRDNRAGAAAGVAMQRRVAAAAERSARIANKWDTEGQPLEREYA